MISSRASGAVGAGRRAHTPIAAAISVTSARADAQASRRRDPAGACATRSSCCRPLRTSSISIRASAMSCSRRFGSLSRHRRNSCRIPGRRVRRQRAPLWLALENRRNRVRDRLAREHGASCQHLVQHAPERPDVGALVDRPDRAPAPGSCRPRCRGPRLRACRPGDRGRVRRDRPAASPQTVSAFASPKSSTLTVPSRRRRLMLRGLQIAMDDPLVVSGLERLGDLPARSPARPPGARRPVARSGRRASRRRPVRGRARGCRRLLRAVDCAMLGD